MRRGVRAYLRRLSFERSSLAARPGLSAESAAGRGCSVAYDTRGLCKFFESRLYGLCTLWAVGLRLPVYLASHGFQSQRGIASCLRFKV